MSERIRYQIHISLGRKIETLSATLAFLAQSQHKRAIHPMTRKHAEGACS
jgi:hypothetical protein